jgi:tagatose-1,6-bisphosphate aldolase non-catalytic subunit AgaZ/GatZ
MHTLIHRSQNIRVSADALLFRLSNLATKCEHDEIVTNKENDDLPVSRWVVAVDVITSPSVVCGSKVVVAGAAAAAVVSVGSAEADDASASLSVLLGVAWGTDGCSEVFRWVVAVDVITSPAVVCGSKVVVAGAAAAAVDSVGSAEADDASASLCVVLGVAWGTDGCSEVCCSVVNAEGACVGEVAVPVKITAAVVDSERKEEVVMVRSLSAVRWLVTVCCGGRLVTIPVWRGVL